MRTTQETENPLRRGKRAASRIVRSIFLTSTAYACAVFAGADPFYLRYDPEETFPEQEGWRRNVYGPSSLIQRSIDDGVFRLDTRASASIADSYYVNDPVLTPLAGESLRITWRMRTVETGTSWYRTDVALQIKNAEPDDYVQFFFAPDYITEIDAGEPWAPEHYYQLIPYEYHDYVFISTDMNTYDLYVDGQAVFHGLFTPSSWFPGPSVVWGDTYIGLMSLSEWDYIEVSVLPEPNGLIMITLFGLTVAYLIRKER